MFKYRYVILKKGCNLSWMSILAGMPSELVTDRIFTIGKTYCTIISYSQINQNPLTTVKDIYLVSSDPTLVQIIN